MRYGFALLVVVYVLGAGAARAEIADSFNMVELARSYAMTCAEQAAERHAHIAPPYFQPRPEAFRNESEKLALYSPQLTVPQREMAQRLYDSVPSYALPLAWRGGAVYVFTRRGIVEAVPALAVERNWFEDYGLYMEVERRLYMPFEKGEGVFRKPGGTYAARRFTPSQRDLFRVINHETGHMVDSLLGAYSIASKGEEDGKDRLSNRPDFRAAVLSDLTRLASVQRPITTERIRKLGYYMPREFAGRRMGMQTELRARREVFAELWAEAHGHGKNKLSQAYPDAYAVVTSLVAFLKKLDETAPLRCEY